MIVDFASPWNSHHRRWKVHRRYYSTLIADRLYTTIIATDYFIASLEFANFIHCLSTNLTGSFIDEQIRIPHNSRLMEFLAAHDKSYFSFFGLFDFYGLYDLSIGYRSNLVTNFGCLFVGFAEAEYRIHGICS